ncbi:hypothetical protein [Ethanoligenens sp.]|uniref:hypothetical protein n=1 Tax=Ethanoligenens sp. TaxID=2099655 RepID=UPI0039ED60EC
MTFAEIDKKIARSREKLAKEQERLEKYTATRKEMEDEACATAARAAAHEWNMQPEEFAKLLQTLGPDGLKKARPDASEVSGSGRGPVPRHNGAVNGSERPCASQQDKATIQQEEAAK